MTFLTSSDPSEERLDNLESSRENQLSVDIFSMQVIVNKNLSLNNKLE